MNSLTDQQLLRDYSERQSETAFAELARRHVDFVYSAALRMVRDAHLAEDVTQSVFVALSKNAGQLTDRPVLSGWLHRTAQNLAANVVRTEVRRRAREQEAVAMNELLAHESDAAWENIAPHLDTALGELSEPDRDALLLRYFERKSAREMAQTLGTSEDAAQKRVNRAVERLRELFSKRNVTVGASGLVVLISTNAIQAAPVGMFATISTAVSLVGTAVHTSTAIAATKTIAMTTLQKTLITATITVAIGTGIYKAHQASILRSQVQTLQQQQVSLGEQLTQQQAENERLSNQFAQTKDSQGVTNAQFNELLKLRGKVAVAQADARELAELKSTLVKQSEKSPSSSNAMAGVEMFQAMGISEQRAQLGLMKKVLNLTEDQAQAISELMQKHKRREMDMAMKVVTGKMTPEQRQAMVAERSNPEDEIKSLLTPEQATAYPEYQQAEKTGAANRSANAEASLIANQFDLSKEQQDQIRAGLSQINLNEPASGPNTKAISAAKASGNLADAASMSIELSKSQLEEKLKILGDALTPKQIDAYREQQLRQLNMMATMMKMLTPHKPAGTAN